MKKNYLLILFLLLSLFNSKLAFSKNISLKGWSESNLAEVKFKNKTIYVKRLEKSINAKIYLGTIMLVEMEEDKSKSFKDEFNTFAKMVKLDGKYYLDQLKNGGNSVTVYWAEENRFLKVSIKRNNNRVRYVSTLMRNGYMSEKTVAQINLLEHVLLTQPIVTDSKRETVYNKLLDMVIPRVVAKDCQLTMNANIENPGAITSALAGIPGLPGSGTASGGGGTTSVNGAVNGGLCGEVVHSLQLDPEQMALVAFATGFSGVVGAAVGNLIVDGTASLLASIYKGLFPDFNQLEQEVRNKMILVKSYENKLENILALMKTLGGNMSNLTVEEIIGNLSNVMAQKKMIISKMEAEYNRTCSKEVENNLLMVRPFYNQMETIVNKLKGLDTATQGANICHVLYNMYYEILESETNLQKMRSFLLDKFERRIFYLSTDDFFSGKGKTRQADFDPIKTDKELEKIVDKRFKKKMESLETDLDLKKEACVQRKNDMETEELTVEVNKYREKAGIEPVDISTLKSISYILTFRTKRKVLLKEYCNYFVLEYPIDYKGKSVTYAEYLKQKEADFNEERLVELDKYKKENDRKTFNNVEDSDSAAFESYKKDITNFYDRMRKENLCYDTIDRKTECTELSKVVSRVRDNKVDLSKQCPNYFKE